jgi:hypothetical protein
MNNKQFTSLTLTDWMMRAVACISAPLVSFFDFFQFRIKEIIAGCLFFDRNESNQT